MTALDAFQTGFSDGWSGARRRRGLGGVYLRAYRAGSAARDRHEHGGEPMPEATGRRR